MKESHLIDIDKIDKDLFSSIPNHGPYDGYAIGKQEERNLWIKEIKQAKVIEAVPVIRCKECRHWRDCSFGSGSSIGRCNRIERGIGRKDVFFTVEDWFCAGAEKK